MEPSEHRNRDHRSIVTCPRLLCQCLRECGDPPVCPGGGVGRSDLQRFWGGREVAEGAVGPDLVVLAAPALSRCTPGRCRSGGRPAGRAARRAPAAGRGRRRRAGAGRRRGGGTPACTRPRWSAGAGPGRPASARGRRRRTRRGSAARRGAACRSRPWPRVAAGAGRCGARAAPPDATAAPPAWGSPARPRPAAGPGCAGSRTGRRGGPER